VLTCRRIQEMLNKRKTCAFAFSIYLIMALVASHALISNSEAEDVASVERLMKSMGFARLAEKVKAPDFALENLEGNTVRLSDHRGKVVMVNFWTTW
jgi:cytochrome oxidase Cu insertion factor (SCO1/SenC/PrrC family)